VSSSNRHYLLARTVATILAGAALMLAAPSIAAAGSYHDFLCRIAGQGQRAWLRQGREGERSRLRVSWGLGRGGASDSPCDLAYTPPYTRPSDERP
jgi:hypothetical protein